MSWQVVLVTTGLVVLITVQYIYILYIIYKTNSVQTNVGKGQSCESSRSHEFKYDTLAQRWFYGYSYDDSTYAQMDHLRQLYPYSNTGFKPT